MESRETSQAQETSRPRFEFGYRGIHPGVLKALNVTRKAAIRTVLITLALTACNEATTEASITVADAGIVETSRSIGEANIEEGKDSQTDAFTEEARNLRDTRNSGDTSMDSETETTSVQDVNMQNLEDTQDIQEAIDGQNEITNTKDTTTATDIATDCSSTDELKINLNAIDIIGQYTNGTVSYSSGAPNNGSETTNDIGLYSPQAVAIDTKNHRLYVADASNNRVKVHILTEENFLKDNIADYVLGQPDFTTNAQAVSEVGLAAPIALLVDNENDLLYVGDYGNKRIAVYNLKTINNGQPAAYVLGQPDFTTNSGTTTQQGMKGPRGLAMDKKNKLLYVSDAEGNHRVLAFKYDKIQNGQPAAYVLGQPDFTTNIPAITQNGMNSPYGLAFDEKKEYLFVCDTNGNRVLVHSTKKLQNGQPAAYVLGQPDFTTNIPAITQNGMSGPYGISFDNIHGYLFITTPWANRILIHNTKNLQNGQPASYVLGQPDFTSSEATITQKGLNSPYGLAYEGQSGLLYTCDTGANRIKINKIGANLCKNN